MFVQVSDNQSHIPIKWCGVLYVSKVVLILYKGKNIIFVL